jgi:hypothetical protein
MYAFKGGIFYDPETGNCYVGNGPDAVHVGELEKGFSRKKPVKGFWRPLRIKRVKLLMVV